MVWARLTPGSETPRVGRPRPTNDQASEQSDKQTPLPMTQDSPAADDALKSMPARHLPRDIRSLKLTRQRRLDSAGSQVADPAVRAAGEAESASHTHSSGRCQIFRSETGGGSKAKSRP